MVTSTEVFRAIKEMSRKSLGSRPRILVGHLAVNLEVSSNIILVLLAELKNRGLVEIHKTPVASVSLTNYGAGQEDVSGGLNS
jgi:Mn-dependent DtxR family transcriptional regulator